MAIYDQHMHTLYSFDSEAQLRDYLAQTKAPVVTTEHLEFDNPDDGGRDDLPDYAGMVRTQAALATNYHNEMLLGIEAGYFAPAEPRLRDYLAHHDFDLTLLSFHHDGKHDYLDTQIATLPPKQVLTDYFSRMLTGIQRFHDADVLAHFDYGVRQFELTPEQLEAWGKAALDQIFAIAVDHDLALELNTKSMYKWHNAPLYDLAITWYQAAGGHLFTIGSDAHEGPHYEANFAQALAMLKRHGVKEIATYRHHKRTMVPIEPPVIDADNAY
ncbi:PHP domain-containing protein [Lacticaseibacillus parahuelsenbergensis]|uniref:Histidinol-phosphatase n=1 Tax=Lacticaseibacillus parahuelsenbergensis TaxID=3068305 RepID=A0ABY9L614_9LACO|nr:MULTISPECIES: PHP domain-containing protein [Lacticaseibacillus]MDE3282199.1 PHP domain-containing protein [Lacticaseibacillus casei]WLV79090.1 PHP domain-containing protein [Lacticaseibacillus sp. NCIMB 15471]